MPSQLAADAGHADELLGRDVGGDQGEADQPPGQAAAGEEVAGGAFIGVDFIPAFPDPQAITPTTATMNRETSKTLMSARFC